MREITYSVAALAASDVADAEKHTRKAEKLLGRTPLTLLLSAQVARNQGDDAKTQALLEQMLDYKETEYLAARSLSESASKRHLPDALALAQRALAVNPQGIAKVVSLHIQLKQGAEALAALAKAKRQLTSAEFRHYKGIVHLEQGLQSLELGHITDAIASARQALKFLPEFSPSIAFSARAYTAGNQAGKAYALITRGWKKAPDMLLADAFYDAVAFEPQDKQIKLTRKLIATHPDTQAGDMLLAKVAIRCRDWTLARKSAKAAIEKDKTVAACKLMAEIEQAEFSDYDASGKWLAASADASADPSWICSACGNETQSWNAHCPTCQAFDTLSWKQRAIPFAG